MKFVTFDGKAVAVDAIESIGAAVQADKAVVLLTTRGGRILREEAADEAAAQARAAELVQQASA